MWRKERRFQIAASIAAVAACLTGIAKAELVTQEGSCSWSFELPKWPLNLELEGCSKNGICIEDESPGESGSNCNCSDPWTGLSDFINTKEMDCQINNTVIQILWAIQMSAVILLSLISLPRIKLRIQTHMKAVTARKEGSGKKATLWRNKGLLAVMVYQLICAPAMISMGALRIIDPSQRVGVTYAATILFAVARFGFYATVALFQPALLETLLSSSKKSRAMVSRIVQTSYTFASFNLLVSTACGLIPMISAVAVNENAGDTSGLQMTVYLFYMGGTAMTLVFYFAQSAYILHRSNRLLGRSYKVTGDDRILELKKRMAATQVEAMRQALVQGVIYSSFLFIPYLYNKHDYWLPIGWIAYPLIGKKLAFTAVGDTGSSKAGSSSKASKSSGLHDSRGLSFEAPHGDGSTNFSTNAGGSSSFALFSKGDSFKADSSVAELGYSNAFAKHKKKGFMARMQSTLTRNKDKSEENAKVTGSSNKPKPKQSLAASNRESLGHNFKEKVTTFFADAAEFDDEISSDDEAV